MITRKNFIISLLIGAAGALFFGACNFTRRIRYAVMKKTDIKKGLVLWYSQTGHTERVGKLIAARWRQQGLQVTEGDYRTISRESLPGYDIIAAGTPVFYYDVPGNFKSWLETIPDISGTPVAAFVTFGGEGGNQHNTACTLLELFTDKGGRPLGINTFGNMSTYAFTWSMGNTERILAYRHLPDTGTYGRIRAFAAAILETAKKGETVPAEGNFSFRNLLRGGVSISPSKLFITNHHIDSARCIRCGTCSEGCPVNAIDLSRNSIDTSACIACLGCVNNCPAQAMKMNFFGKEVYGFREFLRRNNITITEPEELRG